MTRLHALAASLVLGGCGLISSDITNFDLALDDKKFAIDTAAWAVDDAQAQTFLSTSCAGQPSICSQGAMAACEMDCTGQCNAETQTCDLSLDVALHQGVDLKMEAAELSSLDDEPVIKVTVQSVNWQVTLNSLNVDTPPMTVYVAPTSVMDPNNAEAKAIGTVAAVPAGMLTDEATLEFTDTGRADLAAIMGTYKTPFNIIVGSSLLVHQGEPVPTGKLEAAVRIKATAGL